MLVQHAHRPNGATRIQELKGPSPLRLTILLLAALARIARGDETPAVPPPPDKWQYTLFDPVPDTQLRDMDTDRPNVTNTPHTIDAGHWQLETGFLDYAHYSTDSAGESVRSDEFDFGQFNLRLGILNNLELNLAVEAYDTERDQDFSNHETSRASGFGDTVVGGKLNLWGNDGGDEAGSTALAIQPQFKFPTAQSGIGNGRFEASVGVPFLANLPDGFHLGIQAALSQERTTANTGYVAGFPASVSVDRVVFANLDIYLEYASNLSSERHAGVPQTLDVGGTYPLTKNVVLDAGVNLGLNHASSNIEALAGISFRH